VELFLRDVDFFLLDGVRSVIDGDSSLIDGGGVIAATAGARASSQATVSALSALKVSPTFVILLLRDGLVRLELFDF